MQHDVFANPVSRMRGAFPFIVNLQSDHAPSEERLCAPLYIMELTIDSARFAPAVLVHDRPFRLLLLRIATVHRRYLRRPIGSVAAYRDDIIRALDWLFTGI